ncbi:FecR family protein [Hymenobacter swuensis]|uniref:Uncharacterized protein n=1 Tax=Hymenobacter swuensis DY53 TaxID=1227739 RepID=W8F792_9BACT|nr:FecR domain-containing protein [Hymenobacter swuensis]AHJ99892.1 hypothetical protein Hsw_4297 [Hymenobacter swuensis DY53]
MELSVIHELIGKELAGELTGSEQEILTAWLAQASADERAIYEATRHYWQAPVPTRITPSDTATALQNLLNQLPDTGSELLPAAPEASIIRLQPTQAVPWWRSRVAAAVGTVLAASTLSYGLYHRLTTPAGVPFAYEEQSTPRGATAKVLLADGTVVWLNAESRLWFPKKFSTGERHVYLQGEAYFEVSSNLRQPFVLHIEQEQVRVLGTAFNVKAYPEESTVQTAVVEGKVAFIRPADTPEASDTLYVTANQLGVYAKPTTSMHREVVDSRDYTAWNQGKLVFQETPLDEVARTLTRQYNLPVQLANEQMGKCRLTGRFQNQSLREVVQVLSMTGAFGFELSEERLVLTGPGCSRPVQTRR